jgi:hypothetical protein
VLGFALVLIALLEAGWMSHLTLISGVAYLLLLTLAYRYMKRRRQKVQ